MQAKPRMTGSIYLLDFCFLLKAEGQHFSVSEVELARVVGDFFRQAFAFGERLLPWSYAELGPN
jgi:hypothetical protein